MPLRPVRAICLDLVNTLWDVTPVLVRAECIMADWLASRYPRIPERFAPARIVELRAALALEQPHRAHDFTFLRRETLARIAHECGYERDIAGDAFAIWHAARNEVTPFLDVLPALGQLASTHRLATLTNGNADLAAIGLSGHFEVNLAAAALGCAKPDVRAYERLADALSLDPAEVLFVGDEPLADVAGPRNAGMQTAWVNRDARRWPDDVPPPDAQIACLGGLVTLLTETRRVSRSTGDVDLS
jgi:putative hydrolase of the HAD superfamily